MDEFKRTEIFYTIVDDKIDSFKDQFANTTDINHQDKNGILIVFIL